MPVSVMRLTNINKGIIKLLPQIVTLIILITAIPQLAKLTWRVVFPVSPEDISALPLTMPPPADPELKNVRPAFTLFGLAVKNSPTPTDAASLNQVPVSSLKLRLAGYSPAATRRAPSLLSKREISRLALARAIPSQDMMRGSPPFCLTGSSSTIRGAKRPFYYLTTAARRRRRPPPRATRPS